MRRVCAACGQTMAIFHPELPCPILFLISQLKTAPRFSAFTALFPLHFYSRDEFLTLKGSLSPFKFFIQIFLRISHTILFIEGK